MLAYKQFPVFTANQVLRHDHLNDLVNYLEEQGRQTRTQLGGIGIVSGFYISLGKSYVKGRRRGNQGPGSAASAPPGPGSAASAAPGPGQGE